MNNDLKRLHAYDLDVATLFEEMTLLTDNGQRTYGEPTHKPGCIEMSDILDFGDEVNLKRRRMNISRMSSTAEKGVLRTYRRESITYTVHAAAIRQNVGEHQAST